MGECENAKAVPLASIAAVSTSLEINQQRILI